MVQQSSRPNNLYYLKRDQGYRWQERDQEMEELCYWIMKSGLSSTDISLRVLKITGGTYKPSPQTIDNWLGGKVKKPQNVIMTWVGLAIGVERVGWRPVEVTVHSGGQITTKPLADNTLTKQQQQQTSRRRHNFKPNPNQTKSGNI